MNEQTSVIKPNYCNLPMDVEGFDSLAELALDLRWSWNHCTDEVWRKLDPALWELTQNPWVVLQTVSKDKLKSVLADSTFRKKIDDLLQAKRQAAEAPAWFQKNHPQSPLKCVAYFSMEYMLSEALPIYSGGLGNVAGDQLKAASDLGVPVVGVGLLYQQGYFRQVIDKDGAQQALYPYNDPGQLPITPLRQPNGEWLRLEITLPGYAKHLFDPNALTLGFARRFATYKRPNLLLQDPERLLRLLSNQQRPVQLMIAGKAHPADLAGQELIQKWIQFIRRPDVRPHAIFLSDYDMHLTSRLVQGVDVWLNTPRRPWEACGTSGMKVLVNGGINLSELDGWWAEAYVPDLGWALGDGQEHGSDPSWDAAEAEALYERLEREVIPEFYTRNEKGIPIAWVKRMRESMARLTPQFSANRAVCEYTEHHYLPAAIACQSRVANKGIIGKQMVDWRHSLDQKWAALNFGEVKVATRDGKHIIEVQVGLHGLDPKAVRVELYADGIKDSPPVRQEMTCLHPLADESGDYAYSATVSATRPPADYTARVMPRCDGVAIPLEDSRILWQH